MLFGKRFITAISNMKIFIILIIVGCLCATYFYDTYYKTPMYSSSAIIVLAQDENSNKEQTNITQNDILLNKNLLSTYVGIAKTEKTLDKVIKNANLKITSNELEKLIKVEATNNTQVIKISVINEDNQLAANITNELVNVFTQEIKSIYNMNNIHIMDYAEVSNEPYNMNIAKDCGIAIFIGIILSSILVFINYIFDNTIKCEKDVENYTNLHVISGIPHLNKIKGDELIVSNQYKSTVGEAFKTCRANMMFNKGEKKSEAILITSSSSGEGKSFISSNLALTIAKSNNKVLLIDADMRKGRIDKIFKLSKKNGLSECLIDLKKYGYNANINQYIEQTRFKNLHVMTSGTKILNESELLSLNIMKDFIETLKTRYDVIIIDGTPCSLVSDSIVISKLVDKTILVAAYNSTKINNFQKLKKSIEIGGGTIDGVIINKQELSKKEYKSRYYNKTTTNNQINISLDNEETEKVQYDKSLDVSLYVEKYIAPQPTIEEQIIEQMENKNTQEKQEELSKRIDEIEILNYNLATSIQESKINGKEDLEYLRNKINHVKEDIQENKIDLINIRENIQENKHEITNVREDIQENTYKIANVRGDIEEQKDEITNVKENIEEHENEILNIKENVEEQASQITNQKENLEEYNTQLENIKENMNQQNENTSNLINEHEMNIEALKLEFKMMRKYYEERLSRQEQYLNTLENKIRQFEGKNPIKENVNNHVEKEAKIIRFEDHINIVQQEKNNSKIAVNEKIVEMPKEVNQPVKKINKETDIKVTANKEITPKEIIRKELENKAKEAKVQELQNRILENKIKERKMKENMKGLFSFKKQKEQNILQEQELLQDNEPISQILAMG